MITAILLTHYHRVCLFHKQTVAMAAPEYAIVLGVIVLVAFGTIFTFAGDLANAFDFVREVLEKDNIHIEEPF